MACNLRAVALSRTDEYWGSPKCGLMQVESQRLGKGGVPRAAGQQARQDRGDPAGRRKSMVQCRATRHGRSGTEGEQRGTTGRTDRQARESTECRAETATEGRGPERARGGRGSRREEKEARERGSGFAAHGVVQLARHEHAYMNMRTCNGPMQHKWLLKPAEAVGDVTQRRHPLGQWEDLCLGTQRGRAPVAPSTGPPAEDVATTVGNGA